jgi:CHAT domain-containing protein
MAAFSTTCLPPPRWAACALLAAMLCGCGAPRAPQSILTEHCRSLSTAHPMTFEVSSPGAGALRIAIRQRGISVSASLIEGAASFDTVSPVERYGVMTFVRDAHAARHYAIRVISRDSPDVEGEACVSAELLDGSDPVRLAAERALAAAGRATRARHWQAAFDEYLWAARGFDHVDRHRSAEARHAMAQLAYHQLDRPRDSYALAQRALADLGPHADPGLRSALAELQATIVIDSKADKPDTRRERALPLLGVSEALARRAQFGARELARLAILRGFLEYATNNTVAAAGFFAQAAAQCQTLHDWECYARARMNSAQIAEAQNNALALQGYADALQILSPSVAPGLAADIWDNLGRLQGYVGLLSQGEQSQRNAIRLYAQIGNCDGVRRVLSTLGSILVHVGNVDDALVYLNLATTHDCPALLSITSKTASQTLRTLTGAANLKSRVPASARAPARTACSNSPEPVSLSTDGDASVFRALLSISEGAALEGNRDIAQRCLTAARLYAVEPRRELRLQNALGAAFIEDGDPGRARMSFARALAIADQAGLAATHPNRDVAYLGLARAALLAHERSAALRYSAHALMLSSASGDIGQVVNVLQVLAMSLAEVGDRQRARQTLRTAVNLIEQIPIDNLDAETRATYLATQHHVFEDLTDLLVDAASTSTGDSSSGAETWAAFGVSELGRARSLQYAISQATNNDPLNVHAHSAATYQNLLARIAALAASADGAAGWSGAVGQLEGLSNPGQETPEPVNAGQLVSQLKRLNATLIEFAAGRNDMFAFVIDGGDIHVVPLGNRPRINSAAADLYERLHDPESADADVRRAASRLAQLTLWPITRYVNKERVIFVAEDSLYTVPFAVLPWSQDRNSTQVLQHAETAVVPSALFMLHYPSAHKTGGVAPRFELIGDPIFQAVDWRHDCANAGVAESAGAHTRSASDGTESLPRLPGSRTEVLAIEKLARAAWPSSDINVHLGCMATPSALRKAAAGGADLLHIATHGYVDARRPRLSALVLTRESQMNPESGIFGPLDILDIKTAAGLVVLSACETSRGRLLPGEGVLGPAQAFLQSGAASVVASYWRVDDAATAAFMRIFYKYLLTDHLPVATALRRAQLDGASTASAHSWAGFALFGSPDATF